MPKIGLHCGVCGHFQSGIDLRGHWECTHCHQAHCYEEGHNPILSKSQRKILEKFNHLNRQVQEIRSNSTSSASITRDHPLKQYIYTAENMVDNVPRHGRKHFSSLEIAKEVCQSIHHQRHSGLDNLILVWQDNKEGGSNTVGEGPDEYYITLHDVVSSFHEIVVS